MQAGTLREYAPALIRHSFSWLSRSRHSTSTTSFSAISSAAGSRRHVGEKRIDRSALGLSALVQAGLFELFAPGEVELAAQALRLEDGRLPDILCLQEVESLQALRAFNEHYLGGFYGYALLIDCRDLSQIDVAVLSRFPIKGVRTSMDVPDPADPGFPWLFSRDCLEATLELNRSGSKALTVFVNHFKSKLVTEADPVKRALKEAATRAKRERQAKAVASILRKRFRGQAYKSALFAVVGDLNDEPESVGIRALTHAAALENVLERLAPAERWTHYYRSAGQISQFDYILVSPALSKLIGDVKPFVQRSGLGYRDVSKRDAGQILPARVRLVVSDDDSAPLSVDFRFPRMSGVTKDMYASDHCPLTLRIPV
jgi:endonuclease/exonuclease/phosphatase family metal-dependent hydrolase